MWLDSIVENGPRNQMGIPMYAILEDNGTQIKVSQGDVVRIALRDLPENQATLQFNTILAVGDPADASKGKIGQPYVAGASVTADVLGPEKGEKVRSIRFRRRKNILRRKGHRQEYIKIKITNIQA